MTPEQFKEQMYEVKEAYSPDYESIHRGMDELMCELLKSLGYSDGVDVFINTEKWYA